MSEYSELIKHLGKIRDYMRDFYVFGFRSRSQLSGRKGKSGRSYDNERRRIESYLSDFMAFRQDKNGKSIFLSVDSAAIPENPLYRAFKAKTFTKNDITLHFCLLDLLADGKGYTAAGAAEEIDSRCLSAFGEPVVPDLSTIRKKLIEYEKLGIFRAEKNGKTQLYFLNGGEDPAGEDPGISPQALAFFSEMSPLGVAGSYIMDRDGVRNRIFSWKHHYIMPALDSEICFLLVQAMHEKRKVIITNESPRRGGGGQLEIEILPLKILVSLRNGRRYAAAYHMGRKAILTFRLDYIKSVRLAEESGEFDALRKKTEELLRQSWGVSLGRQREPEHLTMQLRIEGHEGYIADRLQREGKHGVLRQLSETVWQYDIDVWDPSEMLPWLRTFIGRVLRLDCTDPAVTEIFYRDMELLYESYGIGGGDVFS